MWMNDTHYSGNPALDGMLRDTALSFKRLLEALRELAGDASQNILDLYAKSGEVAVRQKSDSSPVTDADHASHRLICESLTNLTPAIPVLSEESTLEQLIGRRDWPCCWMIDPLDGTREFLEGTGEFTVNIALIVGPDRCAQPWLPGPWRPGLGRSSLPTFFKWAQRNARYSPAGSSSTANYVCQRQTSRRAGADDVEQTVGSG
jgi:hypothetical protein